MIIFIRHGQSTANAQRLLVGRSDPPLTELGERQARALAPFLGDVVEVWVSPLSRARATAALALPDVTAVVAAPFIELDYGSFEGRSVDVMASDEWLLATRDHDVPLGGGESLASVDRRVHAELDSLRDDASSLLYATTHHLAIVSHVSPIKSAVAWALGVGGSVARRMRLDNGSMTSVLARDSTATLVNFNVVPDLAGSVQGHANRPEVKSRPQ